MRLGLAEKANIETHILNHTLIDWKILQTALLVLLISGLFSFGLVFAQRHYADQARTWATAQQERLSVLQEEFRQVQEAQEIIDSRYNADFVNLDKQQFFYTGDIRQYNQYRLQLADELESAIQSLVLPKENVQNIAYEVAKPYTIRDIKIAKNFTVRATRIRLRLGLLHEQDLLNLIKRLNSRELPGLLRWQSCIMQPMSEELAIEDVTQANFEVNCILTWYLAEIEEA